MHIEVEQKFRVNALDHLPSKLAALGATAVAAVEQADRYYQHPVRDFAATDEALRIRRVGDRNYVTYKGPKVDSQTKTRPEAEVRLADGEAAAATCDEIMRRLGFEPVALVAKRRAMYSVQRGGHSVEIALDDVQQVGHFVEIELVVDFEENQSEAIAAGKQILAEISAALDLRATERRSYLELLLETAP